MTTICMPRELTAEDCAKTSTEGLKFCLQTVAGYIDNLKRAIAANEASNEAGLKTSEIFLTVWERTEATIRTALRKRLH